MLEAYRISQGEKILLVGEGNFSFSKDFVILNESVILSGSGKTEIISTCKESKLENFSEPKQEDILNYLCEKGVTVIFNVDATNLKDHPTIKDKRFSKIIFNFPHVGGKMKIHLNRKLLKDFFSSACDVLEENGCVVVALCDGQGGTEADKKHRRWDDTWQITEMAAQSDFILYFVEPFDESCFPNYVNVGFRSCNKSFHSENAVVHAFKRQEPPHILRGDPFKWTRVENLKEELVFDFMQDNLINPFSNPHSPSSYLSVSLSENFQSSFYIHSSVLKYHCDPSVDLANPPKACVDNILDIFTTVKKESGSSSFVVKVLRNSRPIVLPDFSHAPVRCQLMVFGVEITTPILCEYLSHILTLFNSEFIISDVKVGGDICKERLLLSDPDHSSQNSIIVESLLLPNRMLCHIIHVDELAQVLFKLDNWRSLWDGKVELSSTGCPIFHPTSLFPKAYSFDLGLSVPLHLKEEFEYKFFLILWLLAGDMIIKTEHLSTYLPPDIDLICYCYRITYRSQNSPLYRKRVIQIHEHIIADFICKFLKINTT